MLPQPPVHSDHPSVNLIANCSLIASYLRPTRKLEDIYENEVLGLAKYINALGKITGITIAQNHVIL